MVCLSIIMPTLGRKGLVDAAKAVKWQMEDFDDELSIIYDGKITSWPLPPDWYHETPRCVETYETPPTRHWGNFQRDVGITIARGTHLIFCDDDDRLCNLAQVREVVKQDPDKLHFFEMTGAGVDYKWLEQPISEMRGGSCMVVPNDKSKLVLWGQEFSGSYIKRTLAAFNNEYVLHPDIIICDMRQFSREPG
jgi:hypothetical protein